MTNAEHEPDAVEVEVRLDDQDQAERCVFTIKRDLRKRLDVYLQSRLKGVSRSKVKQLIDLGGVKINGADPKASTLVRLNDVIEIILPGRAVRQIHPEPIPLDVLFEDEHLIVVNKQADLIVHPARSNLNGTLVNALAWRFKQQIESQGGQWRDWRTRGFRPTDQPVHPVDEVVSAMTPDGQIDGLSNVGAQDLRPGVVHRLDRHTTGVMVVAKSDEAHWRLARQFETRTVRKAYLAVCHHQPDPPDAPGGTIDLPIGKHPTIREAMAVRHDCTGKPSVTLFRMRERYDGYSLVELDLKTGRTHQIRVHLTHMGCPIVGDLLYGGEAVGRTEIENPPIAAGSRRGLNYARAKEEGLRLEREAAERPDGLIHHPALHAAMLQLVHPIREETMTFTAPLHEPMCILVRELRGHRIEGPVARDGCWIDLDQAIPDC